MVDPRCNSCLWYGEECEGTDLEESANDDDLGCYRPKEVDAQERYYVDDEEDYDYDEDLVHQE